MKGLKSEIFDCFPRNERGIAIPINLDFDGTVIYHGYGVDAKDFKINGKCIEVLKRWIEKYNCRINIYTTRDGEKLGEVVNLLYAHGLSIGSINTTSPWQKVWSYSSKQYGFVIDDMSACQIFYDENGRATVDWEWLEVNFEPRLEHMKKLIDEIETEIPREEIYKNYSFEKVISRL